jgi:hypothetical protein
MTSPTPSLFRIQRLLRTVDRASAYEAGGRLPAPPKKWRDRQSSPAARSPRQERSRPNLTTAAIEFSKGSPIIAQGRLIKTALRT